MKLRFADVTYDGEARRLLRGGDAVRLSPKAFALLGLLLQRRPAAVSRVEIQDALWPGVFVTEGSIDTLVKELRKAIGDGHGGLPVVRTVHRFGYAFDAAVNEEGEVRATSRHVLAWGHRTFHLVEGENLVGRVREAAVWLGHDSVSRAHARITVDGDRAEVVDLGSRNGTFVSEVRVTAPVVLGDGDDVRFGSVRVDYIFLNAGPSTPTASIA